MGQVFRFYREAELRSIAEQLLRCPSDYPRYGEEEAARKVQQLLQQEGIDAQLQYAAPGRPNVVARLKGAKPGRALLFNGHLDVVPPGEGWTADPYEPVMRDGRLFARGAADMKCGVAALLYTAILFHRAGNPFAGELILLFNADEERENAGMLRFVQDAVQADGALIAEPTGLQLCIGHRGVARYRLTALGQSAHAAFADHPDNAIVHMARLIPELSALDGELRHTRHPLLGSASLSVTQISGGSAPNMIPDSCVVEIDRRLLPGETEENVRQQIVDSIERAARVYSGTFRYRLDNYLFLPASLTEEHHDIVKTLRDAIQETSGALPIVEAFGATCEAHFFANTLGIPTVICGPGHLEQAHTPDEYVRWSEVEDAVKCYAGLLARW
ncbi:M20 family peptidase [Paenibacillus thalictri]|uniref:Probable succinyl-diaminopimelate desuccinylase n=2 Tax=Paenibacillus thalictri TaxID=2527873 RepID=A0A4Q9DG76_9BACL|nr:M20 family peptidase [Paenibacillus thalictri]